MTVNYKVLSLGDDQFLTVYPPGESPLVASNESHSNFDTLVELAQNDDDSVYEMFDLGQTIVKQFADVVEGRVAVRGGRVFFDDDPQDNAITVAILRFVDEGLALTPLVKFMENVMANPQEESREQFYRWIENHEFPLSDDGCIVAYKGVRGDAESGYTSISSGRAFVDGVEHNGLIPNAVGNVVTMPRSEVQHNPAVACHVGLHAGTWEYASDFAQGAVMHVKINPRDVVSVPHDCTSQKVRVCRYEVIGFAEQKHQSARFEEPEAEAVDDVDSSVDLEFKVGDRVVVDDGEYVDVAGEVTEVDSSDPDLPYYVHLDGDYSTWFSEDEVEAEVHRTARLTAYKDTRLNYTAQKRDENGRFVKS